MLFIHIIYYLVQERDKHRTLSRTQNYLATLRENEKRYFEYIFETWQNSRRIRHDLRHMSLLLKEYLSAGEYAKIKEVLKQIQQQTSTFNTEENNDANTKNSSL